MRRLQPACLSWREHYPFGTRSARHSLNGLTNLSRYLFKTATSNRTVQLLPEGKLLWTYRQSKTRKFTSLKLEPLEFMSRFLHPPAWKPKAGTTYSERKVPWAKMRIAATHGDTQRLW